MFDNYDALSFDCYGTLIDWEAGIAAVIGPWARRFDSTLTDEQVLVAYADEEARVAKEAPATLYPDVLAEAFRATGRKLGHPVTDAEAERLGSSVPDWPAFADSHDALAALGERFQLVILSNVDRQSFEGSRQRLDVEFDHIITAQDVGSYKPAQRNFDVLTDYARDKGLRLLHVAQSLFHDHVPARRAGLPGVWINRRHDRPGWGATPDPGRSVTPDWEYPSMAAFAEAARG
ncbi:HAD-IA family hydrolase [Prauserella cavernicola]|uniref:HAD-IA family hydrolase n=1 Tax=Prauserella cavernicola TaxID=2800127 RepID=A0A934QN08_9PSEU|nr:HAD-IA family hydrolase [Prauserella cavernicola]MBK1783455.1 HAD-IA family hydrolase [Prauserella cavernicola]